MSGGIPKPNRLPRKLAGKLLKKIVSKALEAGAGALRSAADRAAETGHEAAEKAAQKRLPIQQSIDIAVPLRVAWEEWEALEVVPEGTHTVTEVERDGNELVGRINGLRSGGEWVADVLDERERESFAWQSRVGSDCAGLVTFHELSDRLTRLELNLDVVPTSVGETIALATHRADRKAEIDLRRFKARLELISPDVYPEEPEPEEPEPEEPEPDEQPDAEAGIDSGPEDGENFSPEDGENFSPEDGENFGPEEDEAVDPEADEDDEPFDDLEEDEYEDDDEEVSEQQQAA